MKPKYGNLAYYLDEPGKERLKHGPSQKCPSGHESPSIAQRIK